MTTNNKAVTCYLPKDIEDFITGYCNEYGITRKDKEGNIYPSLGTGIIELLKLLAYNPELVSSPILDTVPSKFSEDAIEAKIEDILKKKLSPLPDNVPSIELVESLQARLDILEQLLKLQRSASIATHPSDKLGEGGNDSPPSPPDRSAIENFPPSPIETGDKVASAIEIPSAKGLTDSELARELGIDKSNITRWKQKGHPTPKYQNQWELRGRLWYKID